MNVSLINNKVCSFFGHRNIEITPLLKNTLKSLITDLIENKQVGTFYFGGFGDFDELCWEIVTEIKNKYPCINRVFCLFDSRHLRKEKRPKWLNDNDYEHFIYLNLDYDYWYNRIYYRNCEIINQSEYIIFYADTINDSGAYKALCYAKRKKKNLFNLY